MIEHNTIEIEDNLLAGVYQKFPVIISKGKGAKLWDNKGKEYIDCMGGYGVSIIGHCNLKIQEAIQKQAQDLITCHGSLYNEVRAEFAEKLISVCPDNLEKVYLGNSGAETVECALKIARKFTKKKKIIAMKGSYHGKTMGALSTTWSQKYREPFQPLIPEVQFTSYGDIEKISEIIDDDTAAIIIEPIQGESGIHLPSKEFLPALREKCDSKGTLLICDEIQSGLGWTGKMWASEHWYVKPDIMCISKGIGGGIPLGATIARGDIMDSLKVGDHTSTFGGNPLAAKCGTATIDYIINEKLVDKSYELGKKFLAGLKELEEKYKSVREARGLGLMLGLEMRFEVKEIILESIKQGVIILYSGRNIVRLLPPLVISEEQINTTLEVLDQLILKTESDRFRDAN